MIPEIEEQHKLVEELRSSLDYDIGQALDIPFNGSKNPITFFPNKKLIKEAFAWADVIHLHEPFIPFMFWRLHTKKKIIVTHHANIGFLIKTFTYKGISFLFFKGL